MDWKWLGERLVLALHSEQLAQHGGAAGVRNLGLLQSALARPQNVAAYGDPDAPALAASYAFGIAKNHPFIDGNKRTAFTAAATFIELNGYEMTATEPDAVTAVLALAAGEMDEAAMAQWFHANSYMKDRP